MDPEELRDVGPQDAEATVPTVHCASDDLAAIDAAGCTAVSQVRVRYIIGVVGSIKKSNMHFCYSHKFWKKVHYIKCLDDLYQLLPRLQKAAIPTKVVQFDEKQ